VLHVLLASCAFAEDFTWPVVGVIDGDSIRVMQDCRIEEIRLNGSDCPEKGQAYGQRAKHTVVDLAFRNEVTVKTHDRDKYKRTPADVYFPDGTNVNQELVKQG
jgi:endonuclease YncB( thermonuclease family)